jgi:hypothetical protein
VPPLHAAGGYQICDVRHIRRGRSRANRNSSREWSLWNTRNQMTITKTMEASFLSDTDLNLVVGGLSDNPFSDDANQRAGAMIRSGGFGAAIGGNLMNGAGSHGGAIPFPG